MAKVAEEFFYQWSLIRHLKPKALAHINISNLIIFKLRCLYRTTIIKTSLGSIHHKVSTKDRTKIGVLTLIKIKAKVGIKWIKIKKTYFQPIKIKIPFGNKKIRNIEEIEFLLFRCESKLKKIWFCLSYFFKMLHLIKI